jgi:hypothetical protein
MKDALTAVLVTPLACIECDRTWVDSAERWRLKLLVEDGQTETVPYCPDCHDREFGETPSIG